MTPAAALAALRAADVRVGLRPDCTVSLEAAAPPSPELLEAARRHREDIAGLLRAEADPAAVGAAGSGAPVSVGAVSGTISCSSQSADPPDKLQEWLESHVDEVAEWGGVPDLSRLKLPSEETIAGLLACFRLRRPGTS